MRKGVVITGRYRFSRYPMTTLEFYTARKFETANASDIKRFRVIPGDGGHGEPVVCAVLGDGRIGRFPDAETVLSEI